MRHTFRIEGIMINPKLRIGFDNTPNERRSQSELKKFWCKPFIIIEQLEQETWEEHYYRLKSYG